MNKTICLLLLIALGSALSVNGQRTLNYYPEGDDFVCINGTKRYTRALYGSHSPFRLETSDRPVFAAYVKNNSKHIGFSVSANGRVLPLETAAHCEARYGEGNRRYKLTDEAWQGGSLNIIALALPDSDGAIWQVKPEKMPANTKLLYQISEIKAKDLFRDGDLGVDPADAFDAPENPQSLHSDSILLSKEVYILLDNQSLYALSPTEGAKVFAKARQAASQLASRIRFQTPDAYLNPLGSALSLAADGIWSGNVWLHGAVGWRMPLSGWRAAYAGDALGWHDRARTHFDAYAVSQVVEVKPTIPHPAQDSALNLARADKKWGTQMYSEGYICRNPERNDQMHHYDMNLCYMDELMWHFNWTGDTAYAHRMWPVIKRHLAWEKRNFDPDGDGLYDAYCCIWASDALYYNSGAVTHSSAYNYRANKMAARLAALIGEDAAPYQKESALILNAMNARLWLPKEGHWAEFQDHMGHKRLHKQAALWTIYHAIDSELCTPEQAYLSTRYIDHKIPHIPVEAEGIEKGLYTLSTTNWMPYAWSINNVAFAEVMHTALAYWQAGRNEEACRILKASAMDGMYLGSSPGNFGQVSYYDAARGECYRDFGDPVGVASRVFVQGLYGVWPDLLDGKVVIRPGFPADWEHASLDIPDISYSFIRKGKADYYELHPSFVREAAITLQVRALYDELPGVKVNGKPIQCNREKGIEYDLLSLELPVDDVLKVEIIWKGNKFSPRQPLVEIAQPQVGYAPHFEHVKPETCEPVRIDQLFNDSISKIFRNEYLSPRSPYTTLQLPKQGVGEWCHPATTFEIDDSGLRKAAKNDCFVACGVPFRTLQAGNNVLFTSLWDNYPDKVEIPLSGQASHLYLMMAGTTNHMQCHMVNGVLTANYTDGTSDTLNLVNPDNWCPIEQDYFEDGKAFRLSFPRPYRVHLKTGIVSNNLEKELSIKGVYGREIEGGASILLDFPIQRNKTLRSLQLETISNDVIIGIMGITLQR